LGQWNAIFSASFIPTFLVFGVLCPKFPPKTLLFWGGMRKISTRAQAAHHGRPRRAARSGVAGELPVALQPVGAQSVAGFILDRRDEGLAAEVAERREKPVADGFAPFLDGRRRRPVRD